MRPAWLEFHLRLDGEARELHRQPIWGIERPNVHPARGSSHPPARAAIPLSPTPVRWSNAEDRCLTVAVEGFDVAELSVVFASDAAASAAAWTESLGAHQIAPSEVLPTRHAAACPIGLYLSAPAARADAMMQVRRDDRFRAHIASYQSGREGPPPSDLDGFAVVRADTPASLTWQRADERGAMLYLPHYRVFLAYAASAG